MNRAVIIWRVASFAVAAGFIAGELKGTLPRGQR